VPKLNTTDSIMIVSVETFVPPQYRYGNVIYVLCENGRYLNTRWWEHFVGENVEPVGLFRRIIASSELRCAGSMTERDTFPTK
jgi:hypothetical protein